jgi:hypothetical protein
MELLAAYLRFYCLDLLFSPVCAAPHRPICLLSLFCIKLDVFSVSFALGDDTLHPRWLSLPYPIRTVSNVFFLSIISAFALFGIHCQRSPFLAINAVLDPVWSNREADVLCDLRCCCFIPPVADDWMMDVPKSGEKLIGA